MSIIKKNKPRRRFQGFTDDWEQRKLGDITNQYDNLRQPVTASQRIIGSTPYYGANGIQDYVEGYTHNGEFVLIAEDGANDLFDYPVKYVNGKIWVNNHAHVVSGISDIIDNKFLANAIKRLNIVPFLVGGGRAKLNASTMMKLSLLIPNIEEQTKIGHFFKQLDDTIALQERKLEKLKRVKQAYLHEMFPQQGETKPKRRFSGFTDDWEQRKLGELANIVRGASPRPIQDPKWFDENSEVGWLRISDVTEQNGRIKYLEQRISKIGQEKTRVLNEHHLLLSIAATVGKPVVNYVKTGVHDGFLIFLNPIFNQEFLFQWLEMFRPSWKKYGQPGSQVNLNSELVRNHIIRLPKIEEQTKIGNFFKQLDDTIALQEHKLEKLKRVKQAYLHEMFV